MKSIIIRSISVLALMLALAPMAHAAKTKSQNQSKKSSTTQQSSMKEFQQKHCQKETYRPGNCGSCEVTRLEEIGGKRGGEVITLKFVMEECLDKSCDRTLCEKEYNFEPNRRAFYPECSKKPTVNKGCHPGRLNDGKVCRKVKVRVTPQVKAKECHKVLSEWTITVRMDEIPVAPHKMSFDPQKTIQQALNQGLLSASQEEELLALDDRVQAKIAEIIRHQLGLDKAPHAQKK